jgi:TonB family protein
MRIADGLNRRLGIALLVSLLVHGFVLSLRFGVPGLALPGLPSSISVRLADPAPAPPVPIPEAAGPETQVTQATQVRPPVKADGMALLDPVPKPRPKPAVKKDRPRQSRRISTPLPARAALETPTRVLAQDTQPNDNFVVPLAQPEEAEQKTLDLAEAQHGTDEGRDASTAAAQAEAEAARAAELAEAARVEALAEQARKLAEEQTAAAAMAERQKAEELAAQQTRALALAEQQKAEQQKAEERAAQMRAQELVERQKAAQLAEQQRAQELAERRKAEQLAAQQQADEAARQLAEEVARQRAEQQAAEQRERAAAQARAPAIPGPAGTAGGPGGGGGTAPVPKNLLGSDAATRARELSKGIDLLSGSPPRTRIDDERGQRRAVVGSAERDLPLRMYAESWRQKIERNGSINFPQRMGGRARIDPLVSVAIRSDGSVEEVTIVRSSGRADTDEAVRRIVRLNARYSAFPPNIAARYDVIEIRRIWTFDEVLKLIEEAR